MEESQQSPGLLCEIMSPTSGSSKVNKMSFSWLSRVSQQAFQCFLPLPVLVCWAHARSNHFLLSELSLHREKLMLQIRIVKLLTHRSSQTLKHKPWCTSPQKQVKIKLAGEQSSLLWKAEQQKTELRQHKGNKRKELNQYGKTPDTNYPPSRKGRLLPTDGNQLATWLPENTWAAVWSQDANEAEGKVEADLPTSWERRN